MSSSSGSEKGMERNGVRGSGKQGEEIASKMLMIQSKRFYLDIKQNERGRFIKLAEVALNGRKSRLFMSFRICKNIKDLLEKFEEQAAHLGDAEPKNDNGLILSETIINDKRRYYIDLRENQRGAFLRITQFEIQSGIRNSVALPSQGIGQLHDAFEEILDQFGEGFLEDEVELPESQTFRTDGKNFYFDPGHNSRGDFLKITELKPSIGVRNTIALSVAAIPKFTEVLHKLYDEFHSLRAADEEHANSSNNTTSAPQLKKPTPPPQNNDIQQKSDGSSTGANANATDSSSNNAAKKTVTAANNEGGEPQKEAVKS